jgi:peptide/nickel transport system permease protein
MRGFQKFLILRTLSLIPTVLGVLILTFILSHVIPGNPALILIGPEVNESELKIIENELGLNKPLYVQFFVYFWQLIHLNLGYDYLNGNTIGYFISFYFPPTFELALAAMLVGVPIGVVLGIFSALRVNKASDHVTRVGTLLGISMPVFWTEVVFILIFFLYLKVAPAPLGQLSLSLTPPPRVTGILVLDSLLAGNLADFVNAIWHLILPVIALSLAVFATLSRLIRSSMLDIINKDYMRTAFAIGLPRNVIINKYAFKNALLPAITVTALLTGGLMSGVVLTETIFSLPGLGYYAYASILNHDYPAIMAVVMISALLFVIVNFVADVIYGMVDPRIKY